MASVWDDPDLNVVDNYVKFEHVGDTITGKVTNVRAQKFDDGSVAPAITLLCDDGEERVLTGGAIRLKIALAEQRPERGDTLTVTLTDEEKRGGGKTLRHWDVRVQRGSAWDTPNMGVPAADPWANQGPPPAFAQHAAPVQPAAPAPLPPAPSPLPPIPLPASLTPEQRAALAALGIQVP